MSQSKKKATESERPSDMAATVPMIFVIYIKQKNLYIFIQAGKEDNTDAEIERIKAEIETEQKSKETIGETTDVQ